MTNLPRLVLNVKTFFVKDIHMLEWDVGGRAE